MPTISEMVVKVEVPDFPPDELLISEDGVPLESDWHAVEIGLLRELAYQHFGDRQDYFAGGNMFIYFNEQQLRNRDYRGPDFFFVWGASATPVRPYWAVWKEDGRYPNVIIELLSPSTAHEDRTTKKDIYEKIFRTPEYYCYDPENQLLQGRRLQAGVGVYQSLQTNEKGWLWSDQLKLWLGAWYGRYHRRETTWLRFFRPDGALVPTSREAAKANIAAARQEAASAKQKAVSAEQKAMSAEQKAVSAEQKAVSAEQAVDEQRRRAEAAETELARLRAQLEPKKA